MPELRRMLSEFADIRPKDAFTLNVPRLVIDTIALDPTPGQEWYHGTVP